MRNTRWLIVLGLLIGSLLISGSSLFLHHYLQDAALTVNQESAQTQTVANAIVDCERNQDLRDSVRDWCGLIVKSALENQVDPYLIAAVIDIESGGRADALSGSGAVGLMQVMPSDGLASQFQCINGPCFANRPTMRVLYEPSFNISYGSHYLSGLINKYQGNLREALKGYGPRDMDYRYADMVLTVYRAYIE